MIIKEPKYVYNKRQTYAAELIDKNEEDGYVEIKIKGFDNCVKVGYTSYLYELNKEMPEVICRYSIAYFNEYFFTINKNEYNSNLTNDLCIGDNCVETYILKNPDVKSWNPIIYKAKLQLTEKGLYDAKRDIYPARPYICFSEHELRRNYEEQFDKYISNIYEKIKVLESEISYLHAEKNFIQVYKEMQQNAENELDGPEIDEII